jgi:formylglycine-generating enzyme required for sulfatase activity
MAEMHHEHSDTPEVQIAKFAISIHEITWADYERFVRDIIDRTSYRLPKKKRNYPVVLVTWDEALAYTRWLSQQTGYRYRLPSEAEWEYAASGGTTSLYWWGADIGKNHVYCYDCTQELRPRQPIQIGQFKPNQFGLYDTAGNVMEWVQDCYHPSYDGAPTDGSAWESGNCSMRVARGGAYSSASSSLRIRKRDRYQEDQRFENIGFRRRDMESRRRGRGARDSRASAGRSRRRIPA